MAELHIVGQILGGSGFPTQNIFCKVNAAAICNADASVPFLAQHITVNVCLFVQWGIVSGRSWELLEGLDQGQTQLDEANDGEMVVWSHPLDIHYACRGLAGWPKLYFQVWSQDIHGRNDLCE